MKRLLIALGALTLATTAVSAAENFRPTGSVKQEIRWYGDKGSDDTAATRFTLAEGGIRFTENFYIDYRVRDYIRYSEDQGSNTKHIRNRMYYDHGTLGNTEITARQRFGVEGTSDYNKFYYTPEFDFGAYVPGFSTFKLRPHLGYKDDNNAGQTERRYGADLLTYLPVYSNDKADLGVEFNVYSYKQELDGAATYVSGGTKEDSQTRVDIEVYIYASYKLGSWNGIDFAAYFESGMDPYSFYDKKVDVIDSTTKQKTGDYDSDLYNYNDLELQASYAVNSSTSVYGAIAVEYANTDQAYGNDGKVGGYQLMPYAYFGWRTKF